MSSSFAAQDPASPEREKSPEAPPYSPITPVEGTFAIPHGASSQPSNLMSAAPPSEPISESTNPDAIALRAALGILQIQRQRTLRDMQTLAKQKDQALDDPGGFSKAMAEGTIRSRQPQGILGAPKDEQAHASSTGSGDDRDYSGASTDKFSDFGEIPTAQNVARCPPINWSKYHVVGEVLDKLHQDQQTRPDSGHGQEERPLVHQIAAPYNPWTDKLPDKSVRTRSDASKEGPT